MKKKIIIPSIVVLFIVVIVLALLKIKGSIQDDVTLYVDSLGMEISKTIKIDSEPTAESLADMLSDWTGLDFKLNSVEIGGDSAFVDWDLDADLFTELDNINPKKGFYFEDLESLQWFMLDCLAQTLQRNLDIKDVFFTMNDGEILNLTIIILWGDEPYEGSDFFRAHEDNKGDEEESQYTYYDNKHQLLLTYPSVFSENSKVNDNGNISFASKQEDVDLQYWVVPNTYHDTVETFYDSIIWDEAEIIKGENVVVGRGEQLNQSSGYLNYYTTYTFIEADQIATVSITSDSSDDSAYWYSQVIYNQIKIIDVAGMDHNEKGEEGAGNYYYLDNKYQLMLTYPTVFEEQGTLDKKGTVGFASLQDKSMLHYYVVPNVYNNTPEKFYDSMDAKEIERLDGNAIVGLKKELDVQSGKKTPSAMYWLVEEEYIAIAYIECDSMDEATGWYELIKSGNINIDKLANFDDEKGDLSVSYHTYIDDAYDLQLTYTSLFSDTLTEDEYGYIIFESVQDSKKLIYWVISNSNDLTVDGYLEEVQNHVKEIKILGGNACAGLTEEMNQESGKITSYATYWLVEEDYIAIASIECMSMDEATQWYGLLDEGIVNIDVISKMDHDETGEEQEYGGDDYDDTYDMQEYYDDEHDLIIGYPTSFLSEGINGEYNGRSCIEFESIIDNNKLFYLVLDNDNGHDSDSFASAIGGIDVDVLANKAVVSRMEDEDGYYNLYSLVDTDRIVVVYIDCEDLESSFYWHDRLKNGAVYINNLGGDYVESAVDLYKITMDGEDITGKMDLTIIDRVLYVESKSFFEALRSNGHPCYFCEFNENAGIMEVYSWATETIVMYLEPGVDGIYRSTGMDTEIEGGDYECVTFNLPIWTLEDDKILLPIDLISDYLDDGYQHMTIEKQ